jgi:flagellar protein FlgJ
MALTIRLDPNLHQLRGAAPNRQAAKPQFGAGSDNGLAAACQEMESLFIHMMFQTMRATVQKSELIGGDSAEQLYTSMLDAEVSRKLAQAGGIGLARLLQTQLEK